MAPSSPSFRRGHDRSGNALLDGELGVERTVDQRGDFPLWIGSLERHILGVLALAVDSGSP